MAVGGPFSAGGAKTPRHLSPDRLIVRGGCFFSDLKLGDLDGSFGELGRDFQFSAHGFDKIVERTYIPVRAAFDLGYSGPG
jgi:hypothetical protein